MPKWALTAPRLAPPPEHVQAQENIFSDKPVVLSSQIFSFHIPLFVTTSPMKWIHHMLLPTLFAALKKSLFSLWLGNLMYVHSYD